MFLKETIIQKSKICTEHYINLLTKDENIHVPESKKNINVCISGGGMAGIYFAGCASFLTYMTVNKNLKIHKIYGTSAGSIAGLLLILCLYSIKNEKYHNTKYEMNCSKIIYLVNNRLREKYINNQYITDIWIEFLEEIIPPDLYIICCNKLFITINIFDGFIIRKKVISKYKNNKHLLNTIKCSATIPYLTTNNISKYNNYFTETDYYAFDGIFPIIDDLTFPTLYINLLAINYSLFNRISVVDKCYESLVYDGLHDIYNMYHKYLIYHKNIHNIIYYHDPNKYIIFKKILFSGIIIGIIYYNIKYKKLK
jgi:hypothetical protein